MVRSLLDILPAALGLALGARHWSGRHVQGAGHRTYPLRPQQRLLDLAAELLRRIHKGMKRGEDRGLDLLVRAHRVAAVQTASSHGVCLLFGAAA